jgi:uncharacterized membrane protein YdcZ (DUF606 family)
MEMKTILMILTVTIALLLLGMLFGKLLIKGFEYAETKRAVAECEKWQGQALVFEGFYLANWQQDQCEYYGIEVEW